MTALLHGLFHLLILYFRNKPSVNIIHQRAAIWLFPMLNCFLCLSTYLTENTQCTTISLVRAVPHREQECYSVTPRLPYISRCNYKHLSLPP